jgi:nucleotide-binding universal stress UspA family protein
VIRIARILCPVDFSDGSVQALRQAVALAKWYGSTVVALHVHRLHTPVFATAPVAMPAELTMRTLTAEERRQLTESLDRFVAEAAPGRVTVTTLVDEAIGVAAAIVANATALGADLITLGTHGRSGFKRFLLGSVTERVLRTAECPVVTVPPRATDAGARTVKGPPRIVCPVDFSTSGERALAYAISLANEADARLTVLHVIELPPEVADPLNPQLVTYRKSRFEDARQQLARALAGTEEARITPLILAGKPYKEILQVAAEQQAELIVMGVQGRGAIDLALFGSTTHHVVRRAECPVLTVRATE